MMMNFKGLAKLSGVALMMALVSGCSLFDLNGSPRQMAEAHAVHRFDESRLPFGQRYVIAQASYRHRGVYGLNPYFGR